MTAATITPTDEQAHVVDQFHAGDSMKVQARAGTGKTSTLLLVADSTRARGQYVAFNRAIVDEGKRRFGRNVAANTAHSLAYRAVGARYRDRLNGGNRLAPSHQAELLGVAPVTTEGRGIRRRLTAGFVSGLVMRAVDEWCQTADPIPDTPDGWARYVPRVEGIDLPNSDGTPTHVANEALAAEIAPACERAWDDLCRPDGALRFAHGHYLKMWQLEGPRLGADFILFDEAQDASPVMRAVVAAQRDAQVVWVGDDQQEIYAWAGAVNALAMIDAPTAYLTRSFRFGPQIAEVANTVLELLGAHPGVVGDPGQPGLVDGIDEPAAILARTNATAIATVLAYQRAGVPVHLVGGADDVTRFSKSAAALMAGDPAYHPDLACFSTWGEVRDYVEHEPQGGELKLLVDLVTTFGPAAVIAAIDGSVPERAARVVVSTAHKAKGREWPSVQLAADLDPTSGDDDEPRAPQPEELRLLYVAATRARLGLDPTAVPILHTTTKTPERASR